MNGEFFLWGAGIGATSWIAGCFLWGMVEQWRKNKTNKIREQLGYSIPSPQVSGSSLGKVEPQVRIGQMSALNGRLLEVATTTTNRHGDRDFVVEYYIIDETKPLSEEIAVVMLMKGMSK
jgi:hypothetical protein